MRNAVHIRSPGPSGSIALNVPGVAIGHDLRDELIARKRRAATDRREAAAAPVQILTRRAGIVVDDARVLEDLESRPVAVEHVALTDLAVPATARKLDSIEVGRTHGSGCSTQRALRILRGHGTHTT